MVNGQLNVVPYIFLLILSKVHWSLICIQIKIITSYYDQLKETYFAGKTQVCVNFMYYKLYDMCYVQIHVCWLDLKIPSLAGSVTEN